MGTCKRSAVGVTSEIFWIEPKANAPFYFVSQTMTFGQEEDENNKIMDVSCKTMEAGD